jgi:Zn-dependent protease
VSIPWGTSPQGPRRGQGPNPRTVAWVIAGVLILLLLVRSNHLSTFAVLLVCALIPSVVLHEVSHGAVAQALGDDTAKRAGRLTLNPLRHIDPYGTILIPILLALTTLGVIGWAKPVPWTRSRLRHPNNDSLVVTLVGPAVNIALAVVFALTYRFLVPFPDKLILSSSSLLPGPTWAQFIFVLGYVNVILAIMNLLPLPPLDGSVIVERWLPSHLRPGYERIRPFTMIIPIAFFVIYPEAFNRIFIPLLNEWSRVVGL